VSSDQGRAVAERHPLATFGARQGKHGHCSEPSFTLTDRLGFHASPRPTKENSDMTGQEVFISYDYDDDKRDKDRLLEWNSQHDFEFTSYDNSLNIDCDSNKAAAVKQDIAARIGSASHFLCIVGKASYRSGWVKWQIQKALELNKKLVAVKPDSLSNSPSSLQRRDVSWCRFNLDSIKKAIATPTTGILPV
jgi:Thoeris protein ThsB, TIR-like domain